MTAFSSSLVLAKHLQTQGCRETEDSEGDDPLPCSLASPSAGRRIGDFYRSIGGKAGEVAWSKQYRLLDKIVRNLGWLERDVIPGSVFRGGFCNPSLVAQIDLVSGEVMRGTDVERCGRRRLREPLRSFSGRVARPRK